MRPRRCCRGNFFRGGVGLGARAASMRPRHCCRGNYGVRESTITAAWSFNEAAALLPRKRYLPIALGAIVASFNEAAALLPRKPACPTTRGASRCRCFNEAAALLPRKRGISRSASTGRFLLQ